MVQVDLIPCRCGTRIDVSSSGSSLADCLPIIAAPPPSTKHLTDEELKQQYGIHMTSRIEADGESKEAKWADIDDDEDDWAPETIEWADGTKVTLNHANNMLLPPEAVESENPSEEQPKESLPVRPKPPHAVSSVGPNATVLKLGASAERQQAQKAIILQKGPSEKPAPSAVKSPAPVPAKSPWAPLPPVEKVSPITVNPQIAMPPPNRYSQVPLGVSSPSMAIAPSPAKEISADDFNRSWRESQSGQPRELFMPNSGKYEAVDGSRRRGSKNDQNFRAPALLQRPSHGDQHAPAEPSPAFQTNRVSADQERGPWNRRRASSIQSGGSGQFGRRMSLTKGGDVAQMPSEMPQQYRASSQFAVTETVPSSRGVHVQQSINLPQTPLTAGPPGQDMAVVAEQKRLMQESARLAVQRRREEEAQEEAARKERIRLKLEQLGPPPDQKAKAQEPKTEAAPKPEELVAQVSSPPKPPVPEASGEPKQYGMMKVHHPDNVKKFSSPIEKSETLPDTEVQIVEVLPTAEATKSQAPSMNGIRPGGEAPGDSPSDEIKSTLLPIEESVKSWKNTPAVNEPMPSWSSRGLHSTPATTNLWGPPNPDKALGNGTFDQSLTGLSARDLSLRNNSQQQSWLNGRPASHDKPPQIPSMPTMPSMPQESLRSSVSFPSAEPRSMPSKNDIDSSQSIGTLLPRGSSRGQAPNQRWQQSSNVHSANDGVAAWNNFHAVATREERAENEKFQRDLAASLDEEGRTGIRRAPQYIFNETWKQVEIGDQAGDRQVASVAKGNINPSFPAANPYGAPGSGLNGDRATNGLPIRGSRFFPTEARRAVTYSHPEVTRSPSPPPAEEVGGPHPAYEGDTKRPIINLPVPKAVVKLPKPQQRIIPAPNPPAPPRTFAAAVAAQPPSTQPSLRAVSQPLVSTPDWQHRFNDLFGRKSPPKKQVLAVAPSSREPLDVIPPNVSAAVSLPPKEMDRLKDAGKVTSRDVEDEEDLFEDREAASTPLVQIPTEIPENLLQPARAPQLRPKGRFFKPEIVPLSVPSFDVADDLTRGFKGKEIIFYIHLPFSTKSTKKTMPRKASNGFVSKGPKPHTFNKQHKKGPPKSRESSGSSQNVLQNNRANNSRTPPTPNGSVPTPRSGFSHNNNSSSNNNTTNTTTNNGWREGHFASAGIAH
jgi:hypothetical protein